MKSLSVQEIEEIIDGIVAGSQKKEVAQAIHAKLPEQEEDDDCISNCQETALLRKALDNANKLIGDQAEEFKNILAKQSEQLNEEKVAEKLSSLEWIVFEGCDVICGHPDNIAEHLCSTFGVREIRYPEKKDNAPNIHFLKKDEDFWYLAGRNETIDEMKSLNGDK